MYVKPENEQLKTPQCMMRKPMWSKNFGVTSVRK